MVNKSENVNNDDLRDRRERFDQIAVNYEKYRPGYPKELIGEIFSLVNLSSSGTILEVGSGSGKATELLAQRGHVILCLEPSNELISLAKVKFQGDAGVVFSNTTFEDWQPDKFTFDLVVSAQAFHWIDPSIGYKKTAAILRNEGWLALFWNMYPKNEDFLTKQIDKLYRGILPEVSPYNYSEDLIGRRKVDIEDSGYFKNVLVKRFFWKIPYSTEEYVRYLDTFGVYSRLSDSTREVFFQELARTIDSCGGVIEKPFVSLLYLAQKA